MFARRIGQQVVFLSLPFRRIARSRQASTQPLATRNSLLAIGVEQDSLPLRVSDCLTVDWRESVWLTIDVIRRSKFSSKVTWNP